MNFEPVITAFQSTSFLSLCMGVQKSLHPFIKIYHAPGSLGHFFFAPQQNSQCSLNSIVFCSHTACSLAVLHPFSRLSKTPCRGSFFRLPIDVSSAELRILASYEANIAKICNFWTFWPVIQLMKHLLKI